MAKSEKTLPCGCVYDTLNVGVISHCKAHEEEWKLWVVKQKAEVL